MKTYKLIVNYKDGKSFKYEGERELIEELVRILRKNKHYLSYAIILVGVQ